MIWGMSMWGGDYWGGPDDLNPTQRYIWIILNELQEAFNAIRPIEKARDIETVTGQLLDVAGEMVGETRQGKGDNDYRLAIKTRILINNSNGTPEDVIGGLSYLTDATDITYAEDYPAKAILNFTSANVPPLDLRERLEEIATAGVQLYLTWIPQGDYFAFAGEGGNPPLSGSKGFSEEGVADTGGKMAEEF